MIRLLHNFFQSLFHFTSTDRGAFTVLIPALVLLAGWPRLFMELEPYGSRLPAEIEARADSIYRTWNQGDSNTKKLSPSPFNPNTLSAAGFRLMGVDSQLSERIVRYRAKGGKFRKSSDLLKMWGMDSASFQVLEPFIQLGSDSSRKQKLPVVQKSRVIQYDINLADTADFESVPGIGKKMAARIIRYRTSLGGFIEKNQLYEIYGIDSLAVFSMEDFFVAHGYIPTALELNSATYDVLEAHPYLTALQARAILFYRYQHGEFRRMEDLGKVKLMDEKTLMRIRPYIRLSVP